MSKEDSLNKLDFPIYKTRVQKGPVFRLEDRRERLAYFNFKAGKEIKKLKNYLKKNTFMAFLIGKKNSGKGTYSKMFMEAVGSSNVAHVSIGDIVRSVHRDLSDKKKKKELVKYLESKYRGFMEIEEMFDIIEGRDTSKLLPTEVILALVEREIDKLGRKAVFVDGFPRDLDQVSVSLYFRALMGYRDDPDFFVFISVPNSVIDERIKSRVVCPNCNTPRGLKLLRTKEVGYDPKKKEFYLICDNPACKNIRMLPKEGDELGIEAIRDRIEADEKVSRRLLELKGVPKIFLRNSIPVSLAKKYVNDYEITPVYNYKQVKGKVEVVERPWTVKDDQGRKAYSLLPATVALSLIRQMAEGLEL